MGYIKNQAFNVINEGFNFLKNVSHSNGKGNLGSISPTFYAKL